MSSFPAERDTAEVQGGRVSPTWKKNERLPLHTGMNTSFTEFLIRRLSLREVSEYFPVASMNQLFWAELNKILTTESLAEDVTADLERLTSLNLVGYVDSSVRRSGVAEADRDEVVHDLLVRLLVSPGSLFRKWNRQGPLSARIKVAVRNSLISVAKKRQRHARRFQDLPDTVASPTCPDSYGLIEAFRDEVRKRFGAAHLRVFDTRMVGNDIKGQVGSEGIPTSYRLKQIVQDLKELAGDFGDECIRQLVRKMQVQEAETLRKRFGEKETLPVR